MLHCGRIRASSSADTAQQPPRETNYGPATAPGDKLRTSNRPGRQAHDVQLDDKTTIGVEMDAPGSGGKPCMLAGRLLVVWTLGHVRWRTAHGEAQVKREARDAR